MRPAGKLLIIGGAIDLGQPHPMEKTNKNFVRFEILNKLRIIDHNRIEIITTGSEIQDEIKIIYEIAFKELGVLCPGFIPINTPDEALNPDYLDRISQATAVFFTGGDQNRIVNILKNTIIIDIIKNRYLTEPDFLIAGTSAGAMAMCSLMITTGGFCESLIASDLKISEGLGILDDCIVDTHFIKRGRFSRLAHAIIINQDKLGIGLGEDTALIIENGDMAECNGSGMVVIIDGQHIDKTNINSASANEPIFVENIKVDILVKGSKFSIKKRAMI